VISSSVQTILFHLLNGISKTLLNVNIETIGKGLSYLLGEQF